MSFNARLLNIEDKLNKANKVAIVRFCNSNGSYPQQDEDIKNNVKIIKIMSKETSIEELRSWSK